MRPFSDEGGIILWGCSLCGETEREYVPGDIQAVAAALERPDEEDENVF